MSGSRILEGGGKVFVNQEGNAMNGMKDNPESNSLRAGVTADQVTDAVMKSGYPLQTIIAQRLQSYVQIIRDEWSYLDRESSQIRTTDISAEKWLFDIGSEDFLRPMLDLIIECKTSELPYVFFTTENKPYVRDFPYLAGLPRYEITAWTDDDRSTWSFPILDSLDLRSHPFRSSDPPYCMSFTNCVRKGGGLALSGAESFHSLILPLVKAQQHFRVAVEPPKTARYFDFHRALAVGVLDAPMVSVRKVQGENELSLTPWVRVVRHESVDSPNFWMRDQLFAVDVVHEGFFEKYLSEYVIPFAKQVATLALGHQQEIMSGSAFVSGLGRRSGSDIEPRMKPRSLVRDL